MSISQYVIGGLALVTALSIGYVKWNERGVAVDKAEARTAIAKAECVTDLADDVTQSALKQVTTLTAEVERQKRIAADEAKKSQDRLRENNELRRKINNATENPPIPDAAEFALDRLRGAIPGAAGADRTHENGTEGEAGDLGGPLPPATEPAS